MLYNINPVSMLAKQRAVFCIHGAICSNPYSLVEEKCLEHKHILSKLRYVGDVHRHFIMHGHNIDCKKASMH